MLLPSHQSPLLPLEVWWVTAVFTAVFTAVNRNLTIIICILHNWALVSIFRKSRWGVAEIPRVNFVVTQSQASRLPARFWHFHSWLTSHLCCLCSLACRTHNCARLLIDPHWKATIKSTEGNSHGNSVRDVVIAQVINADAQTNSHD